MLYQLIQALHLGGKDYPKGNHDLPVKAENDPHFLHYVGKGLILDVDVKKAVSLETPLQRSKKLYDRLIGERDQKKISKEPKEEVKAEAPKVEAKEESQVEEKKEEAKVEVKAETIEELKAKAEANEKKEPKSKKVK